MESDKLLSASNLFEAEIMNVRTRLMIDINNSIAYDQPKDNVIKEVSAILQKVSLSDEEKNSIKKRLEEFETPPPDKEIQFNCQKNTCNEGA